MSQVRHQDKFAGFLNCIDVPPSIDSHDFVVVVLKNFEEKQEYAKFVLRLLRCRL